MSSDIWSSYPKVYTIGHSAIKTIFSTPVLVEEKIDGSQFSFGSFDGELRIRSKGKDQTHGPDKMFQIGHDVVSDLHSKGLLRDGWMYSGEYLNAPKHNTIAYSRVPRNNIILFDIRIGIEEYMPYGQKAEEAQRLGFEVVPRLYKGKITGIEILLDLLERESVLGGHKIEGFVVKSYDQFTRDGKTMLGKFVSEEFKEKNNKDFKARNPKNKEIVALLGEELRTEARWKKSVQRLRDNGQLQNAPQDIGLLMKEIIKDTEEEEKEEIKEKLFKYAWKHIARKITTGFPEWYKNRLLESAFEDE